MGGQLSSAVEAHAATSAASELPRQSELQIGTDVVHEVVSFTPYRKKPRCSWRANAVVAPEGSDAGRADVQAEIRGGSGAPLRLAAPTSGKHAAANCEFDPFARIFFAQRHGVDL